MNLKKLIKVPHEAERERDRHRESERQPKLAHMCVATLVRACVLVREESLTPAMPLLKTTSGWGIKRRHWSLAEKGGLKKRG